MVLKKLNELAVIELTVNVLTFAVVTVSTFAVPVDILIEITLADVIVVLLMTALFVTFRLTILAVLETANPDKVEIELARKLATVIFFVATLAVPGWFTMTIKSLAVALVMLSNSDIFLARSVI